MRHNRCLAVGGALTLAVATMVSAGGCVWQTTRCAAPLASTAESVPVAFHARRAALHLSVVPEPGSPLSNGIPGPGLPDELRPLSLFGRSVGGALFIDWDQSPWGAFREVRLLCGLVAGTAAVAWGAWASHVFVNSADAADGGRKVFGLPTSVCTIDVAEADAQGNVLAFGQAPLVHLGDGLGPLGRVDSPAKIVVGMSEWTEAGPLVGDQLPGSKEEPAWSQQLRDDRALRTATSVPETLQSAVAERTGAPLPWPVPEEIVVSSLSGCLPPSGTSFRADDEAENQDNRRLLQYTVRLCPRLARRLPGRRPTGGIGVVPRVCFESWQPLIGFDFCDVKARVSTPKLV